MNWMQKQFTSVLQMPLMPEKQIFRIILKLSNPKNENIEFSKKDFPRSFKWHKLLQK